MSELTRDEVKCQERLKAFQERLRAAGIKLTHQRIEIFKEIATTEEHPDAETVYLRVKKRIPTISLDTVYRTLWFLKDLGLITTLGTPHDRIRFDANIQPHQHFICTKCGSIKDLNYVPPGEGTWSDTVEPLGRVETIEINFKGICAKCLQEKAEEREP